MVEVYVEEPELGDEVVEDVEAVGVVGVYVGVAADVDGGRGRGLKRLGDDGVLGREGDDELGFLPVHGQVDGDVEGGGDTRVGEEDGEDRH